MCNGAITKKLFIITVQTQRSLSGNCLKISVESNLKTHIKSKYEGVKYAYDQCDNQATMKINLKQVK